MTLQTPFRRDLPGAEVFDHPIVVAAYHRAEQIHRGHEYRRPKKRDNYPYIRHLVRTAEVLVRFGVATPVRIAAALLHDSVEDRGFTVDEARREFGDEVADAVASVTDPRGPNGEILPRDARKALILPQTAKSEDGTLVKLADRIDNAEQSVDYPYHIVKYRREMPAFEAALYRPGIADAMWDHLRAVLAEPAPARG